MDSRASGNPRAPFEYRWRNRKDQGAAFGTPRLTADSDPELPIAGVPGGFLSSINNNRIGYSQCSSSKLRFTFWAWGL